MADVLYTTIGSGARVSGQVVLPLANPYAVLVSSGSGASAWPEFGVASGGPFRPLFREDGSGVYHIVSSGAFEAFGVIPRILSPWVRIGVGAATNGDVRSLAFTLLTRRW
jgi:hypothetical protein